MVSTILSVIWLPYVLGYGDVHHDVASNRKLRGQIAVGVDVGLAQTRAWRLSTFTSVRSVVRDNTRRETPFRISPEQVHYPVGVRLRWPISKASEWGLVAFHQSNHDVDTTDITLNSETISYEIYGIEWAQRDLLVQLGLYYDRGTRLDGTLQNLPFNYYLAGLTVNGDWSHVGPWYSGGEATVIAHRNQSTSPSYLTVNGHLETGFRFTGLAASVRVFVRASRLTDYPVLGAQPHHLIGFGMSLGSISIRTGRMPKGRVESPRG